MKVHWTTSTNAGDIQLIWYSLELTYRPLTTKNVVRFNIEHHTTNEYEVVQDGINEHVSSMMLFHRMLKVGPRIWR